MSDVIMPVVESVLLAVNIDEKSSSVVHAVQSDNLSRIIRVGFWDKDIEYVLDPESKVRFMIIRPDGIFAAKDCTINEDGNYAEVVLDEDLLSVPGDARAGFIVWDKDQEQSIRSQEFTLHIGEKLDKDENLPIDAPVTLAVQVKKNTEDIAELKKNGVNGPTKEELSYELKSAWSNSIRKEIAFKSASHPYTDALLALLETGDAPVTPDNPVDPPDSPVAGESISMSFDGTKAVITGLASTNITYSGTVAVIGG